MKPSWHRRVSDAERDRLRQRRARQAALLLRCPHLPGDEGHPEEDDPQPDLQVDQRKLCLLQERWQELAGKKPHVVNCHLFTPKLAPSLGWSGIFKAHQEGKSQIKIWMEISGRAVAGIFYQHADDLVVFSKPLSVIYLSLFGQFAISFICTHYGFSATGCTVHETGKCTRYWCSQLQQRSNPCPLCQVTSVLTTTANTYVSLVCQGGSFNNFLC